MRQSQQFMGLAIAAVRLALPALIISGCKDHLQNYAQEKQIQFLQQLYQGNLSSLSHQRTMDHQRHHGSEQTPDYTLRGKGRMVQTAR